MGDPPVETHSSICRAYDSDPVIGVEAVAAAVINRSVAQLEAKGEIAGLATRDRKAAMPVAKSCRLIAVALSLIDGPTIGVGSTGRH